MTELSVKNDAIERSDGWANVWTGMGLLGKDKTKPTFYLPDCRLNQIMLDNMYYGDGIVKTIVNLVPEMMLSKGFEIEGDDEFYIKSKLESLSAIEKIMSLMYWSRLYGGAIIVMGIEDGRDLSEPVDETMIRDIKYLHVFDRYQVPLTISAENIEYDMDSENYGLPIIYPVMAYGTAQTINVHHSRILRMDGIELPGRMLIKNQGWGESEIQACYQQIANYASGYNNAAQLISDFVQCVFSVEGLSKFLSCGNKEAITARFEIMDMAKSNYKMIIKDNLEKYEKVTSNISGIPELLDRFMMALSSVCRIPVSLLFGRSAAGLNATGEYDMLSFYDHIIQQQEKKLRPVLEKLVRYIFLSKDGAFNGLEPENWSVKFNPLTEMSPVDEANYRKTIADTDRLYIETGVLTPEEVRENRFASGVYSANTIVDPQNSLETPDFTEEEEAFLFSSNTDKR